LNIRIFYDGVKFRLRESGRIRKFIEKVILDEKMKPGDLFFIFTDNKRIREINIEFLNHDYNTDVISFDFNTDKLVNGEIYISIDSVRINSKEFGVSLREEVIRVMIHGTLHILGYRDSGEKEKGKMVALQEEMIKEYFRSI
jgi:rRNA maturation RNase YbeY